MMRHKWLVAFGAGAIAVALFVAGVGVDTLLVIGAALLCPAVMFFGMSGMNGGCGHSGKCDHANASDAPQGGKPHGRAKAA